MNFPRRKFLGNSGILLGSTLLEALATPLWKWNRSLWLGCTGAGSPPPLSADERCQFDAGQRSSARVAHSGAISASPVTFVNVAREAGLTTANVWGGVNRKRYIIEAKGSG